MPRIVMASIILGVSFIGLSACDYDGDHERPYYRPAPPVVIQAPASTTAPPVYYAPPPAYYLPPGYSGYYGHGDDDD